MVAQAFWDVPETPQQLKRHHGIYHEDENRVNKNIAQLYFPMD